MSYTYAIADIHGRDDLLESAFERIASHAPGGRHTIITLGDYIDRGPQSRQVIERLMRGAPSPNFELICLRGNHEDIMLDACSTPAYAGWWVGNGGGATLVSYGQQYGDEAEPSRVPVEHQTWARSLPLFHLDDHRIFVHAGVKPGVQLADQELQDFNWMLYPDGAEDDFFGRHIVHGHQQFADGPKCYAGRTDLDTFAWHTGRLVIGVFDDKVAGGPVELLEVLGPSFADLREEAFHG